MYVDNLGDQQVIALLQEKSQRLLSDIRYEFLSLSGTVPEEILRVAESRKVTDIVIGKRGHQPWEQVLVGSVSQAVLETSLIPVILVESRSEQSMQN